MKKEYYCCICYEKLETKPIRLVKQINDNKKTYNAYHNEANYDFCAKCYSKFDNWLKKHNRRKK